VLPDDGLAAGDPGAAGEADLRPGCKGGNHYIIGERLRSGSPEADAALSRQGGYQEVAENLRVREVRIAEDERFVICWTPRPSGTPRSAPS
jgi:hypothetical protein